MDSKPPSLLSSLRFVVWAFVVIILAMLIQPYLKDWFVSRQAVPRPIAARGDLAAEEHTTIEIFEASSPSVVFITTVERVLNLWTRNVLEVPRGTGSGFIWDEDGHVVTNYHVVKGAQAAQVRLADQRSYEAVLVGASSEHDLAVLRINVALDRPPPVPIGSSHDLRVGQKVFAIGNPFGLDHTLTTGIVSALDRTIQDEDGGVIEHLIQTDAAINPGNSGGPLIDSAGRLIGINTAIYSPSGAYAGIGFAVPVDTVNRVVPRLVAHGRYVRPALGIVSDDDISENIGIQLGVEGLLVLRVDSGSPAERAGLRGTRMLSDGSVEPGDIILSIDDKAVRKTSDLEDILEDYRIGDRVKLSVYRSGQTLTVQVTLEQWAS
jgi:S1-C subfamily serine protease